MKPMCSCCRAPCSGQAGEGYMRIACTLGLDQLGEAFDRLEKLSF